MRHLRSRSIGEVKGDARGISASACPADSVQLCHHATIDAPEAFSRVIIDAQLKDAKWNLTDGRSVRFEYVLGDGCKADYVLADRRGRALAVIEAKRMSIDPVGAEQQARDYAKQLGVPLVFLANGKEIWFWDYEHEAHPHPVKTFFSQADLERRAAARATRRDLLSTPIDKRIVNRPYQRDCIDALCKEIIANHRKLLVEMVALSQRRSPMRSETPGRAA